MSKYQEVTGAVDPELKARLLEVLSKEGISASDFIRSAAIHAVNSGRVPFPIEQRKPGTRYAMKEMAVV